MTKRFTVGALSIPVSDFGLQYGFRIVYRVYDSSTGEYVPSNLPRSSAQFREFHIWETLGAARSYAYRENAKHESAMMRNHAFVS